MPDRRILGKPYKIKLGTQIPVPRPNIDRHSLKATVSIDILTADLDSPQRAALIE
jgi:hypothetical protein